MTKFLEDHPGGEEVLLHASGFCFSFIIFALLAYNNTRLKKIWSFISPSLSPKSFVVREASSFRLDKIYHEKLCHLCP